MYRATRRTSTVTDGGVSRDVHITMNEPLRLKGMTLYQSRCGRDDDGGVYSVFAVVYNPSDRVPMIACSVIGARHGAPLRAAAATSHLEGRGEAPGAAAPARPSDGGVEAAGSAS